MSDTRRLEEAIDAFEGQLPALGNFVLPGTTEEGARMHLCRVFSRRLERALVALDTLEAVPAEILAFVNRLSALFYVLARYVNHAQGIGDVLWRPGDTGGGAAARSDG